MVVHTCNSSTQEVEAGGSGFKNNLDYMANTDPIWDTWDSVSNKQTTTTKRTTAYKN